MRVRKCVADQIDNFVAGGSVYVGYEFVISNSITIRSIVMWQFPNPISASVAWFILTTYMTEGR